MGGGEHGPAGGFRSAPAPRRDPRGFKQPCCPQINALQSAVPHRSSRPAALMLRDPPRHGAKPRFSSRTRRSLPKPPSRRGFSAGHCEASGRKSTPTKRTLLKCCSASCPQVHLRKPKAKVSSGICPAPNWFGLKSEEVPVNPGRYNGLFYTAKLLCRLCPKNVARFTLTIPAEKRGGEETKPYDYH